LAAPCCERILHHAIDVGRSRIAEDLILKKRILAASITVAALSGGCAIVAVTDAAVTVAATVVKVGAHAVGAVSDVASAGVRVVADTVRPAPIQNK
jgi:hypothetical protein